VCFHAACDWCEMSDGVGNVRKHWGKLHDRDKCAWQFHWCCVSIKSPTFPDGPPQVEVTESEECSRRRQKLEGIRSDLDVSAPWSQATWQEHLETLQQEYPTPLQCVRDESEALKQALVDALLGGNCPFWVTDSSGPCPKAKADSRDLSRVWPEAKRLFRRYRAQSLPLPLEVEHTAARLATVVGSIARWQDDDWPPPPQSFLFPRPTCVAPLLDQSEVTQALQRWQTRFAPHVQSTLPLTPAAAAQSIPSFGYLVCVVQQHCQKLPTSVLQSCAALMSSSFHSSNDAGTAAKAFQLLALLLSCYEWPLTPEGIHYCRRLVSRHQHDALPTVLRESLSGQLASGGCVHVETIILTLWCSMYGANALHWMANKMGVEDALPDDVLARLRARYLAPPPSDSALQDVDACRLACRWAHWHASSAARAESQAIQQTLAWLLWTTIQLADDWCSDTTYALDALDCLSEHSKELCAWMADHGAHKALSWLAEKTSHPSNESAEQPQQQQQQLQRVLARLPMQQEIFSDSDTPTPPREDECFAALPGIGAAHAAASAATASIAAGSGGAMDTSGDA